MRCVRRSMARADVKVSLCRGKDSSRHHQRAPPVCEVRRRNWTSAAHPGDVRSIISSTRGLRTAPIWSSMFLALPAIVARATGTRKVLTVRGRHNYVRKVEAARGRPPSNHRRRGKRGGFRTSSATVNERMSRMLRLGRSSHSVLRPAKAADTRDPEQRLQIASAGQGP